MRVIVKNENGQVIFDERKSICVNVSKRIVRVFLDEILYIESSVRKLRLVCPEQTIEFYGKIGDLEEQLSEDSFVRCHKSYLVNLEYLRAYDAKSVTLLDGTIIPVSKQRGVETKKRIIEFYGNPL